MRLRLRHKNSAIRSLTWVAMLVVVNGTRIGDILQREAEWAVALYRTGKSLDWLQLNIHLAANPDTSAVAWWIVFGLLTYASIYVGNHCVTIWGDKAPAPMPVQPSAPPVSTLPPTPPMPAPLVPLPARPVPAPAPVPAPPSRPRQPLHPLADWQPTSLTRRRSAW